MVTPLANSRLGFESRVLASKTPLLAPLLLCLVIIVAS